MTVVVGSAFALIALASVAFGNPAAETRSVATGVARATILNPATLRTTGGGTVRLEPSDRLIVPPRPRAAERPCDATAAARRCPAIVFDLP